MGLIQQIVDTYTNKYTCACMAEWAVEIEEECGKANDYLFQKINEQHITKEELRTALDKAKDEAVKKGTAFCWDSRIFTTKFFRD